jgi:nucleoside-diphosphate-sugar epimerase
MALPETIGADYGIQQIRAFVLWIRTGHSPFVKILVTGATGYIGSAAAGALLTRGHEVLGLVRSERSAATLRDHGIEPAMGDFDDPASLGAVVAAADVDAVVSTASVGASAGDNATTFARDRDAVLAMQAALVRPDQALVFTSGSAVFGVFNDGHATHVAYDEDSRLPLPASTFAPPSAGVHPMLVAGFGDSMAARVETEQAVLRHPAVRGIVIRPGLVYGRGDGYDIPTLIGRARARGRAAHLGSGGTTQSYVHVDELAELYCLAVERAPHGATLHGVVDDVSQRRLAQAVNRMLGAGDRTDSLTLVQMLGMNAAERLGLTLTKRLPLDLSRKVGRAFTPPPSVGSGISLSLDKRLSSETTRRLTGWSPVRTDILRDIESGSYASQEPRIANV